MEITKNSTIGDVLDADRTLAPYFFEMGMHCLGCPSSQMETIAEAAMVHGIEPDDLVSDINDFLEHDLA